MTSDTSANIYIKAIENNSFNVTKFIEDNIIKSNPQLYFIIDGFDFSSGDDAYNHVQCIPTIAVCFEHIKKLKRNMPKKCRATRDVDIGIWLGNNYDSGMDRVDSFLILCNFNKAQKKEIKAYYLSKSKSESSDDD